MQKKKLFCRKKKKNKINLHQEFLNYFLTKTLNLLLIKLIFLNSNKNKDKISKCKKIKNQFIIKNFMH